MNLKARQEMSFFSGSKLTKKPIYNLEEFPQFVWLKNQYQTIQDELKKNRIWMRWGSDDYDPTGHCMFLTGDWTVCPIYFGKIDPSRMNTQGMDQESIADLLKSLPERYPKTIEILKNISNLRFSAFSRLHPKSKLAPHSHQNPFGLIFHLGIIIPSGNTCGLKVGDKTHIWSKAGDAVIFDDNFEHSAWNDSDEERIVLYVDFERSSFL